MRDAGPAGKRTLTQSDGMCAVEDCFDAVYDGAMIERNQPYDYEAAFAGVPAAHPRALLVCVSPIFFRERQALAAAALRNGAGTVFGLREFVDGEGLLAYGASISGLYRRAADYVARIAQGAKPADLPVKQPTKFELVINLKTAKALGLTIPPALLARADELIE